MKKKKEMTQLTKKERKMHNKQKVCHICKIGFSTDDRNGVAVKKEYFKVKDHCHYTGKF